jgi:hypothetical protein
MPAAIIEYSMAVAPESPRQKRIKDAFIGSSSRYFGPLTWAAFVSSPRYELVNAKPELPAKPSVPGLNWWPGWAFQRATIRLAPPGPKPPLRGGAVEGGRFPAHAAADLR